MLYFLPFCTSEFCKVKGWINDDYNELIPLTSYPLNPKDLNSINFSFYSSPKKIKNLDKNSYLCRMQIYRSAEITT